MAARALMLQGTGSDVGKSLLTAALCRLFTQAGLRVRPFKAQNMSNNADIANEGGEIGRAQAEQARACRITPSVLMNPILLKPTTDVGSQVVVLGKSVGTMDARAYEAFKPSLRQTVLDALAQLQAEADLVIVEGAGSPAEINLKDGDLVNMWIAKHANASVLLVGDIDRGGVFAQLVGTMELLDEDERRLVRGFLINKFRGDVSLLEPGLRWLEARCGRPVVGVIPYLPDLDVPEEDTRPSRKRRARTGTADLTIDVVSMPRLSNFTDFDWLEQEPDVALRYVDRPSADAAPDCVILPGTKSTMADLRSLRERGLAEHLTRCAAAGAEIVGICGGFQMMGRSIRDPGRVESSTDEVDGLGLLPAVTTFEAAKVTERMEGVHLESGLPVTGYEIHMGRTQATSSARPVLRVVQQSGGAPREDGLQSDDGRIWGTYLHGLFEQTGFRRWWLNRLRARKQLPPLPVQAHAEASDVYDRLADAVRPHLNLERLLEIAQIKPLK